MHAILFRTQIAASIADVYKALTTEEGLSASWTDNCTVEARVGSVAEFRFGSQGETVYEMKIEKLESDRLVSWHCLSSGLEEWPGTRITWTLEPDEEDGGTFLSFSHSNWARNDGMFPDCAYSWAMVIACLSRYVVQGIREPWFQSGVRG